MISYELHNLPWSPHYFLCSPTLSHALPCSLPRSYTFSQVTVSTDEICQAIKDGFMDTRCVLEPAGALAIAGVKKWVGLTHLRDQTFVAIASGANMDFDRLRFVSERADSSETMLSVAIPERPGAFRGLIGHIFPRNVTEFSYRLGDAEAASVYLSFQARLPSSSSLGPPADPSPPHMHPRRYPFSCTLDAPPSPSFLGIPVSSSPGLPSSQAHGVDAFEKQADADAAMASMRSDGEERRGAQALSSHSQPSSPSLTLHSQPSSPSPPASISLTGLDVTDLRDNELAKSHLRHLGGGRAHAAHERLIRFEFPERPGALSHFLDSLDTANAGWNVSLFQYRNHGADIGRVLAGLQVPPEQTAELHSFLERLGYTYCMEDDNAVTKRFL